MTAVLIVIVVALTVAICVVVYAAMRAAGQYDPGE